MQQLQVEQKPAHHNEEDCDQGPGRDLPHRHGIAFGGRRFQVLSLPPAPFMPWPLVTFAAIRW